MTCTEGKADIFQPQMGKKAVFCEICLITESMTITEFIPFPGRSPAGQHLMVVGPNSSWLPGIQTALAGSQLRWGTLITFSHQRSLDKHECFPFA